MYTYAAAINSIPTAAAAIIARLKRTGPYVRPTYRPKVNENPHTSGLR